MQKAKRSFILFIVIAISCLSAYLTFDMVDLIFNNGNVIVDRLFDTLGIVFMFTFTITVFGIISAVFNWKVLKSKTTNNDSELLDFEEKTIQKHSGFLYISYYIFGLLLFTFGLFFIYQIIIESSNRSEVNVDELFIIITVIILVIGALFNR
ncbi:MAG: hypothetical protein ACK476_11045, partial [Fluviicola sp.]